MSAAVLSIGSNLGDRMAHLQVAVEQFHPWITGISQVFETPPWGPVEQQPFLNAVLLADDPWAQPMDWLERAHAAEEAAARTRVLHWGPRTLDVDVIAVDEVRSLDPVLTLPHPYAKQRAFVLVPWLQVAPTARLDGVAVAELIAGLDPHDVAAVHAVGEL